MSKTSLNSVDKDPGKCRLVVFRSNKHISVQLVRESDKNTIFTVTDFKAGRKTKLEKARETGMIFGQRAVALGAVKVVFDRRSRPYRGRVRAVADGAREGGLKF